MTRDGLSYRLYVPATGSTTHVRPGSAIVGEPTEHGVDAHFEGGGHASNVVTFEDFVTHAAGRRAQSYPTIARGFFPDGSLVDVGAVRFDGRLNRWVVSEVTDAAALEAWAPGPHVVGGSEALRAHAAGALYARFTGAGHADYAVERQRHPNPAAAILAVAARPGRLRG